MISFKKNLKSAGGGLKFRSQPYNYALTTKPASVIWIAIGSD